MMKVFAAAAAVFTANLRDPSLVLQRQSRSSSSYWKRKRTWVSIVDDLSFAPAVISRPKGSKTDFYPTANHNEIFQFLDNVVVLIGSSATVVSALVFFGFLAWRRDAQMVAFVAGSIINSILAILLKRIINQARPTELAVQSGLKRRPQDNGMPSSHAMGLSFIAAFTSLCEPWSASPLVPYTLVSLYYRVQVKLHTWQQILVGTMVGAGNGFLWHRLCQRSALLDWIQSALLNSAGRLPAPLLVVPVVLGTMVVGSLEDRLRDMKWWDRSS